MTVPVLIVVTGPAGSGKTSLAHKLAKAIRCPAISRDEIKEGMAFGEPDFVPTVGDQLTKRTLPVFFGAVSFLLESGVTVVAEAAFQHHVWVSEPDAAGRTRRGSCHPLSNGQDHSARARSSAREAEICPCRRVSTRQSQLLRRVLLAATSLGLDVPSIDVDTTSGYAPTIHDLATWVADGSN